VRKPGIRRSFGVDKIFLTLVMIYLLLPLAATLAFGLSNPKGGIFSTYQEIFSDPGFTQTLLLSLELAVASTILTVVLITPTAYWVQLRLPRARPIMDFLSLVPFAIPAIIMAFGLIEVYGTGTPLVNVLSLGLVPLLSNDPFNIVSELFGIYTFPIYIDVTGQNDAYKAASLAFLSFVLTLICVLAIIFLLRFRPGGGKDNQIEIAAAR
jgi:ABC-type spermidine/putrescine transport system permease subunit I